jgi:hypothetical protein
LQVGLRRSVRSFRYKSSDPFRGYVEHRRNGANCVIVKAAPWCSSPLKAVVIGYGKTDPLSHFSKVQA